MAAIKRAQSRRDVLKTTALAGLGTLLGPAAAQAASEEPHDDARELVRAAL